MLSPTLNRSTMLLVALVQSLCRSTMLLVTPGLLLAYRLQPVVAALDLLLVNRLQPFVLARMNKLSAAAPDQALVVSPDPPTASQGTATPTPEFVRDINRNLVNQAHRFVYSRRKHDFVLKWLRTRMGTTG